MLQLKPSRKRGLFINVFPDLRSLPTLATSEDFEGTETLLRAEISEGWKEPKKELD